MRQDEGFTTAAAKSDAEVIADIFSGFNGEKKCRICGYKHEVSKCMFEENGIHCIVAALHGECI